MLRVLNALPPIPYEVWREGGVLHMLLPCFGKIGAARLKDMVRVLGVLDPDGSLPVVLEVEENVRFTADARVLLARLRMGVGRPLAFVAADRADRDMASLFVRFLEPAFPLRIFPTANEGHAWAQRWLCAPRMRVVHAC